MKKLFLTLFAAVSLVAFELEFDKKFETKVAPDTAVTYLKISLQKESERDITQRLQEVATYINGYRQVDKEGGEFTIEPNYYYENSKRVQDGMVGYMKYRISSSNIDNLDMFLDDLLSEKKSENIEVKNYGYEVSQKLFDEKLEQLRLQSILWSIAYAKDLSAKIYKSCEVSHISFSKRQIQPRMLSAAADSSRDLDASFAPQPTKHEQTITLNPKLILECK